LYAYLLTLALEIRELHNQSPTIRRWKSIIPSFNNNRGFGLGLLPPSPGALSFTDSLPLSGALSPGGDADLVLAVPCADPALGAVGLCGTLANL